MATHDVKNQPPPLEGYDVFAADRALNDAIAAHAPGTDTAELSAVGRRAGSADAIALGFAANAYPPELHTHDRFGHRIDEVRFAPAWHELMRQATAFGLHGTPWTDAQPYPHVRRAAKFYVWSQVEAGHGCPISMTYAAVPALRVQPEIANVWVARFASRAYEPQLLPVAQKTAAICGMAMTEKQGGSDVRANETTAAPATPLRGPGAEYVLTGHKWFCSAPMSDAFLVLAKVRAPGESAADRISCFFVPRVLPDATRNPFFIQRLKDKLGNRSNASAEIEFDGTHAWLIGEEGRGVQTIVEMVNHTRLDCIGGSASLMRQALAQAIFHARHRTTFGRRLAEHPLMANVLADLALEVEAATALLVRLAAAIDRANDDPVEADLKRIGTAIGKYYVCKRAPAIAGEALECLGGNGYVEESIMPRLYREAPVNSIWEGSGNINALDVLRIAQKRPQALEALRAQIAPVMGDARIAAAARALERDLADARSAERNARSLAERLVLLWQAALLIEQAPPAVSDAFVASRLGGSSGRTLGTLPAGADLGAIVDRAAPVERELARP